MFSERTHRFFFLLGTAIIAISLPLSPYLMSVGQFVLVFNWLLEFEYIRKFKLLKSKHSIILITSIYLIHVVWLFNSSNLTYGLHDLKIKLPFLALPIIFGTSRPLSRKEFSALIHLFASAVIAATLISLYFYLSLDNVDIVDNRNTSIFISHIRFALLVVMALYILIGVLANKKHKNPIHISIYITLIIWLLFHIFFIGAFTGIVIVLMVLPFTLIYWLKTQQNKKYFIIGGGGMILLSLFLLIYLSSCLSRYLNKDLVNIDELPKYTINNNPYIHYKNIEAYENGNSIWVMICDSELKSEWNKRSNLSFDGKDKKKQKLRSTLIRYLASKNYSKDSLGISQLSEKDISMVEMGYTNYIFLNKWSVYPRLYELFWEIEAYKNTGNPSGHSLSQRLEMAKNGIHVVKRHLWIGTGTGDVNDEVMLQYKLDNSILKSEWQFRPHNQYVSFLIAFGIIGFILLFSGASLGIYFEKKHIDIIFLAFILISLFSMLSEDTLETQAGSTFVAYFLSLLLFGRTINNDPIK